MPTAATADPANKSTLRAPGTRVLSILAQALLLYWSYFFIREALAQFVNIDWERSGDGDVAVDWRAATLFWRGVSPYSPEGLQFVNVRAFGHPPTTPFWFLPLADLNRVDFAQFIGLLDMALALGLIAAVVFTLRVPKAGLVSALLFGIVQALPPALEQARIIQISVWIAFAYALAWVWLRRGEDAKAGCVLGLACTLKFFPALLVVFLALERRWRGVAAAVAAFLAIASVMTWRWGIQAWPLFFQQQSTIAVNWMTRVRNASLHGIIRRAMAETCEKAPLDDPRATLLITSLVIALLGLATWLWHRVRSQSPTIALDYGFALFSLLSCFLNPWVWEHYFYILILPAILGWYSVVRQLARQLRAWTQDRAELRPLLTHACVTGLAGASTYAAYLTYQHVYRTNAGVRTVACDERGHAPVDAWLMAQHHYFELVNWLPWALFIVLFFALLGTATSHAGTSSSRG